jgi:hypothetical protein
MVRCQHKIEGGKIMADELTEYLLKFKRKSCQTEEDVTSLREKNRLLEEEVSDLKKQIETLKRMVSERPGVTYF